MYICITGSKNNKDVYIKQSYRKDNGQTSSRIYKKLGKYIDLLEQFSGDEKEMIAWAKKEANPLYPVPVIWGKKDFRRLIESIRKKNP